MSGEYRESITRSLPRTTTVSEIHAALVAALNELPRIAKGNTAKVPMKSGGTYSYTYADLGDVIDSVRPVLYKNGLAVMQDVTGEGRSVFVQTLILHTSGDVLRFGPISLPAGDTPQTMGSAVTYCRRYALLAALGIATEDDDGQAAKPAPEPTYSKAALDLYEQCRSLPDAAKAALRDKAAKAERNVTPGAFDNDRAWAEQVRAFIKEHSK
jgi:hypothetical protein